MNTGALENSCFENFGKFLGISEAYPEPCQTSKMELYAETINGFWP